MINTGIMMCYVMLSSGLYTNGFISSTQPILMFREDVEHKIDNKIIKDEKGLSIACKRFGS